MATKIPTRRSTAGQEKPEVKQEQVPQEAEVKAPVAAPDVEAPAAAPAADENAAQAGTQAAAGEDTLPGPAADHKDNTDEPGLQRPKPGDLTEDVYKNAVDSILVGERTVDYCVSGMSSHFGVPQAAVRDELEKRVAAAKAKTTAKPDEDVAVNVPRAYQVWIGGGYKLVKPGPQRMKRSLAEHPYSKDNGVKIV